MQYKVILTEQQRELLVEILQWLQDIKNFQDEKAYSEAVDIKDMLCELQPEV